MKAWRIVSTATAGRMEGSDNPMLKNKSILLLTLALCALSGIVSGAKDDELAI